MRVIFIYPSEKFHSNVIKIPHAPLNFIKNERRGAQVSSINLKWSTPKKSRGSQNKRFLLGALFSFSNTNFYSNSLFTNTLMHLNTLLNIKTTARIHALSKLNNRDQLGLNNKFNYIGTSISYNKHLN